MNEHKTMTPYERAFEAMMAAKTNAYHAHHALVHANQGVALALKTGHDWDIAKSVYEEVSARVKRADEALESAVKACLELRGQP